MADKPIKQPNTQLVRLGRQHGQARSFVNLPAERGSTVLFDSTVELKAASKAPLDGLYYGRHGNETTFAFEAAVAELDGCDKAVAVSSGLAAIGTVLLATLKTGDHLLMVDSVYGPTRKFCETLLAGMGVTTEYYPPRIGAQISSLIKPNTRLIFTESPGSLTFELQDIPAICQAAQAADVAVAMDNTWATPLFFDAHSKGVDYVIHAATKYIVGHADAMLGVISCSAANYPQLKKTAVALGHCPGSEEIYLGLRGLRTLAVRLQQQQQAGLEVAHWLEQRQEVISLLHPAMPSSPDHQHWLRDFSGACGLFGVVLQPQLASKADNFIDALELFGIGYSWGGYESLALRADSGIQRSCADQISQTQLAGPCIRLHIGLESVADLIADLEQAFAVFQN